MAQGSAQLASLVQGMQPVGDGQASNPGPPQTRNRPRGIKVAEDILASLEHDVAHRF